MLLIVAVVGAREKRRQGDNLASELLTGSVMVTVTMFKPEYLAPIPGVNLSLQGLVLITPKST